MKVDKTGVLVFPFSKKGACWETYLSLCDSRRFRVAGVSSIMHVKCKICEDHYFISSTVDDPDLRHELEQLMVRLDANILIPVHDEVMFRLKPHFGNRIPGSGLSTIETCRSKSATYAALQGLVKVPKQLDGSTFPCFIKPDRGQGSRGAKLLRNAEEFDAHHYPGMLVLEYLPGEEYTVDCLSDSQGRLIHCAPRLRIRIENGIAVETRGVDLPEAVTASEIINGTLKMRGTWFCQFKRDINGELTLLEVAPRIAGASAINRIELGVNLTERMLIDYSDNS